MADETAPAPQPTDDRTPEEIREQQKRVADFDSPRSRAPSWARAHWRKAMKAGGADTQPNPNYAVQVHDHRVVDAGIRSAVAAGVHTGESLAAGKVPGLDENETREGRAVENEQAEEKKIAETGNKDIEFTAEQTEKAKKAGQVKSSSEDAGPLRSNTAHQGAYDSGMSWGRAGGTESTRERNAETIQPEARAAMGIDPGVWSPSLDPNPLTLGKPLVPVSGHGSEGNMNAAGIFEATKIG